MKELDVAGILQRLEATFRDKRYRQRIATSRKNWNELSPEDAFRKIIEFFQTMQAH